MARDDHTPKPNGAARSNETGFFNLGPGWVPLEYLLMVKCLDPKGRIRYREITSSGLHPVEALGMCETMKDTLRAKLMSDARAAHEWDEE